MRIFEEEIIKRIKIIQNFVKSMDGKVKQIRAQQKHNLSQHKSQAQLSSSRAPHMSSLEDLMDGDKQRPPERLRDLMTAADGGLEPATINATFNQHQIKEAVKWELEVVERKTEDRFRELEQLIKKIGVKIDKNS